MRSIQRTLSRRLSVAITLLVITVLLAADIAVDTWIEAEFEHAMKDKTGLLKTLVKSDEGALRFFYSSDFLPEFEGAASPEYFQVWIMQKHGGKPDILAKSATLDLYSAKTLPYRPAINNDTIISTLTLPDGRSGKAVYSQFDVDGQRVLLAYADSTENVNYYLWFIDVAFLLALIIIPLIVRFTVKNTVAFALSPLESLNANLRKIRFSARQSDTALPASVEELNPVIDGVNHFIFQNYSLFERERRLTSDIAHELKTPVTELKNLAEMAIRFPDDPELEPDFKPEVLRIANRMSSVIANLMLIHKYSNQPLKCSECFEPEGVLTRLASQLDKRRIRVLPTDSVVHKTAITSNLFAFETILSNLLRNALKHSPEGSSVQADIRHNAKKNTQVVITNMLSESLSHDDIKNMFNPLWQKDASRTSAENFGLGLSIVDVLTKALGGTVSVTVHQMDIRFTITLPNSASG
ncbi:sensor histidine kinase [Salinimonas lutimaris]|uniref:sensor histidine kinase n=1 Tax=Salinimonas lutimaris TaxID=914153 RepID=UPI0010C04724|nr:HAMP domain-containing sensor histidine kinase [Salinimonas lutimaris]